MYHVYDIYIYIHTDIHHTHIYIHIHIHIYIYITMINPSSAIQTIVTQIKDILAATTVTTIVKIKARTNNTWQMKITPGAITKTIITLKE